MFLSLGRSDCFMFGGARAIAISGCNHTWCRTGAGTAVRGGAQLYADTWTGDRHGGTTQDHKGYEKSLR